MASKYRRCIRTNLFQISFRLTRISKITLESKKTTKKRKILLETSNELNRCSIKFSGGQAAEREKFGEPLSRFNFVDRGKEVARLLADSFQDSTGYRGHFVGRFRQKLNLQFIARPVQLSAFERAIIWQIYRATLSSVGYYTSRTRHVPSNEDKCSIVPTEINYLRLLHERNKKKNLFRSLSVARSEKRILILLLHISLLLEMVTNIRPENSPFI